MGHIRNNILTVFLFLSISLSVLSYQMNDILLKIIGIIGIIINYIVLLIIINVYFKSNFYKNLRVEE